MDDSTLLLRSVNELLVAGDGGIAPREFRPHPERDNGKLSTQNGDDMEPQAVWQIRNAASRARNPRSVRPLGIAAVSVGECRQLGLTVIEDGTSDDPHHVSVDFAPIPADRWRTVAVVLAQMATERGLLYRSDEQ
ncbi:MAG: hypothetical protein F4X64_06810 [Chloroflexi bacterium]|nr:hypothetical protein [Chloroflexota bacterium]